MSKDKVVWSGSPSQLTNVWTYVISAILTPLIIGPFIALWAYLNTKGTTYTLTNSRLRYGSGVLNKTQHSMELYRVKDIALSEPILCLPKSNCLQINFTCACCSGPAKDLDLTIELVIFVWMLIIRFVIQIPYLT